VIHHLQSKLSILEHLHFILQYVEHLANRIGRARSQHQPRSARPSGSRITWAKHQPIVKYSGLVTCCRRGHTPHRTLGSRNSVAHEAAMALASGSGGSGSGGRDFSVVVLGSDFAVDAFCGPTSLFIFQFPISQIISQIIIPTLRNHFASLCPLGVAQQGFS
jgi:hypothetical protein